eukprot:TRINITY_DN10588_c0_g1_i1.p1 TRINITY_DN10588_c0_g1~~TRINITY_DN10588_c0_g1_i1.p1  ORF type:complete len:901 (+),score=214.20 TRINITY_DN10588_c0_g1_i1:194-2704(+)
MDGYRMILNVAQSKNTTLRYKAVDFLNSIPPPGKLDVDVEAIVGLMGLLGDEFDLVNCMKITSAIAKISVYDDSWSSGNVLRPGILPELLANLRNQPEVSYHLIYTLGLLCEYDDVRNISLTDLSLVMDIYMSLELSEQSAYLNSIISLYKHTSYKLPVHRATSTFIKFLTSDSIDLVESATSLIRLICEESSNKEVLAVVLGPLLNYLSNESTVDISLELLKILSVTEGVTEEILKKGGLKKLLTILNTSQEETTKESAKTLLHAIVQKPENKIRIVETGDIKELLGSVPKDIADEILSEISFQAFVERGALPLDIAQALLASGVDPSANDNATIIHACTHGMLDIVQLLLKDPRVDPSDNRDTALRAAASNGHVDVVRLLLSDKRVSPSAAGNSAIITACENGHYEIFALLYADPRVEIQFPLLLSAAIQGGSFQIVEELLHTPNIADLVNPATFDPLAIAIQWHSHKIVELLLDSEALRPLINPACHENLPLLWAARNGYTEIVEILLCDSRVDPCAADNTALRQAVLGNHHRVVELLLKDHRPDPSFEENLLIRNACAKGFLSIATLLLDDPRVDPSAQENAAIRAAAKKGYDTIIVELLAHELVDPSDVRNEAIISAASEGYIAIVKMLCHDPRVDPSARKNQALKEASAKGFVQIVEILLHDERVDPSVGNIEVIKKALELDTAQEKEALWKNFASRYAKNHNHTKVATIIETDPRASPAFLWNYAIHNKNVDFVKLLLNDERINTVHIKNAFSIASKKGDFDIMELLLQAEDCDISLKDVGRSIATGFTMMRKKIDALEISLDDVFEGQEKMQKKMDLLLDLLSEKMKQ